MLRSALGDGCRVVCGAWRRRRGRGRGSRFRLVSDFLSSAFLSALLTGVYKLRRLKARGCSRLSGDAVDLAAPPFGFAAGVAEVESPEGVSASELSPDLSVVPSFDEAVLVSESPLAPVLVFLPLESPFPDVLLLEPESIPAAESVFAVISISSTPPRSTSMNTFIGTPKSSCTYVNKEATCFMKSCHTLGIT